MAKTNWNPPAPVGSNSPYPGTDPNAMHSAAKKLMRGDAGPEEMAMLSTLPEETVEMIAKGSKSKDVRAAAAALVEKMSKDKETGLGE